MVGMGWGSERSPLLLFLCSHSEKTKYRNSCNSNKVNNIFDCGERGTSYGGSFFYVDTECPHSVYLFSSLFSSRGPAQWPSVSPFIYR